MPDRPTAATPIAPPTMPPPRAVAGKQNHLLGVGIVLLAMFVVPFTDAAAKFLSDRFPVSEIAWLRYVAHLGVLLPLVVWREGARALIPRRLGYQLLRGVFMVGSTFLFFLGLTRLPMADTLALVFLYPMTVTALSAVFLKERVGWRRWSAVAAGLVGTLVIIRPGSDVFQWWSLIPMIGGTSYAFYLTITRAIGPTAPPLVSAVYAVVFGTLALPLMPSGPWLMPMGLDLLIAFSMGAGAAFVHFLLALAYQKAPASLLAPFGYSEMAMAATLGYLIFGDLPDTFTWIGIAIIIAAGIYISIRESRAARR